MNSSAGKLARRALACFVLAFCLCGATAALAQSTPAQGNSYQGTVASVDSTKNSFVINSRTGESTTVQTTDKTKVTKSADIGLSGLKVGDQVTVNGQVDTTALTVDARRITVRAEAGGGNGARAGGGNGRSIRGAVATTTPKLTVTGDDGKTYTVQTADNIQVLAPATGTFGDIKVGANVRVRGKADSTGTVTAKSVEIRPAGGRGRRRQQAAQ